MKEDDFCPAREALAADRGPGMWPGSPLSVDCPRCDQGAGKRCNEVDTDPIDFDKVIASFAEMREEGARLRSARRAGRPLNMCPECGSGWACDCDVRRFRGEDGRATDLAPHHEHITFDDA